MSLHVVLGFQVSFLGCRWLQLILLTSQAALGPSTVQREESKMSRPPMLHLCSCAGQYRCTMLHHNLRTDCIILYLIVAKSPDLVARRCLDLKLDLSH